MLRKTMLLGCIGLMLGMPSWLPAQTPPPAGDAVKPPLESPNVLPKDESLVQIRKARELLRLGGLQEADRQLRGNGFTASVDGIDPRLASVMRGVKHYHDGQLRLALNEARDAFNRPAPKTPTVVKSSSSSCGKAAPRSTPVQAPTDNVQPDAALLRAFVYARAGVIPLSLDWAMRTQGLDSSIAGAASLRKVFGSPNDYVKVDVYSHPMYPQYHFDLWHGNGAAKQRVVVVIRKDDSFLGAIALEPAKADAFDLKFYDLDAPPLSLRGFESKPDDDEILKLASSLNPAQGQGRFTVMRAELEALAAQRNGVTPFAAWWSNYAGRHSSLIEQTVRQPLRDVAAGEWTPREVARVGKFNVRSYANTTPAKTDAPREHFHFALLGGRGEYLGSLIVDSRMLNGEEVFALNWLHQGNVELVDIFAAPPTLAAATEQVKTYLRTGTVSSSR